MRRKRRDHPKHNLSTKAKRKRSIAKMYDAQRRKEKLKREAASKSYQQRILALL